MQTLIVAGIGPGSYGQLTQEVVQALSDCDCVVGYPLYLDLLRPHFPEKSYLGTAMRQEEERCRLALEQASGGKKVVFVCGGDAGVYGLAGLILELAQGYPSVKIRVQPGVTAALAGAALLGAPLVHDFALVSLSDALTPWELIERRLRSAADGDFCIVLYNPASHRRKDHLRKACDILLAVLPPERPCGYARQIGREGEYSYLCTLSELREQELDMFATVFIGNSSTRVLDGRLVTPRGYRYEREHGA